MRHAILFGLLAVLAGAASAAPQVRLDYAGDVHGVTAHAAIVYEDLRLQEGTAGWWLAGDGSVLMVGSIDAGETRYSFTADIIGHAGYGDALDHATGDRFRVHVEFPTSIERFVLTANPFEGLHATSYLFDLTSDLPRAPTGGAIHVNRASLKLDFRRSGRDAVKLKVRLPDRPFAAGSELRLDVGGSVQTFVLDADGRGRTAHGSVRVKRSGGGLKVKIKLKRLDARASWAVHGLIDANVSSAPVDVPLSIVLGGQGDSTDLVLTYKAKVGKKGRAR